MPPVISAVSCGLMRAASVGPNATRPKPTSPPLAVLTSSKLLGVFFHLDPISPQAAPAQASASTSAAPKPKFKSLRRLCNSGCLVARGDPPAASVGASCEAQLQAGVNHTAETRGTTGVGITGDGFMINGRTASAIDRMGLVTRRSERDSKQRPLYRTWACLTAFPSAAASFCSCALSGRGSRSSSPAAAALGNGCLTPAIFSPRTELGLISGGPDIGYSRTPDQVQARVPVVWVRWAYKPN